MRKNILHRLLAGFYVLLFPALLLGLTRYSYRAKELLVCWLVFCSLFALLAVLLLGSVLACYAVHHLLNWMSVAKTVSPELVASLARIPQEIGATPRILVAGTLETLAGPYPPVNALDAHSSLLIKVPPSTEESVYN
jgi:hypothetical protein